jgi:aldehyde dehydrogenase (NAD+)/betaine-aldehyde dehydrogenase
MVELAIEAGFPPGTINVVPGYGETAGAALSSHPDIDHISFTGSVDVGRIISHAAAENLIPVTMELGGKSPNIVFADANLDRAVPVIVNSILQMAGQTCSAGSRLLVDSAVHAPLVSLIKEAFSKVDIGQAIKDPTLGPLITAQQRDRVIEMISCSSSILFGGHALNGGELGDGYFFEPTLIDDVDPAGIIGQEELFGPVLAVTRFEGIDEAIALANGTDFGLVAGVWTADIATAQRMIRDTMAGQVFVNTYGASGGVELPFGGFKRSGFGREKGAEGLRSFVQVKTAVIAS